MRGLIALRKHFVQNSPDASSVSPSPATAGECAQPALPYAGVLASLFGVVTIFGEDQ
jgi:hypothetical protein